MDNQNSRPAANMTKSGHPRIRVPAESWEYETYAAFKSALRTESSTQSRMNALRNVTSAKQIWPEDPKLSLYTEVSKAIKYLTVRPPKTLVDNHADLLMHQLENLLASARKMGYLDANTLKKIETLIKQLGGGLKHARNKPHENLQELVQMLNDQLIQSLFEHNENLIPLMEKNIQNKLPPGVRLVKENPTQVAVDAATQLIKMTMTPKTESMWQTKVSVRDTQPTVGRKYSRIPIKLGQLVQGLSQMNFFGTLRYFWYSSQAEKEIKSLLVYRYLNLFANAPTIPQVLVDDNGILKSFTPDNIMNMVEGLAAKGDPAAKRAYLMLQGSSSSNARRQSKRAHGNIRSNLMKKQGFSQSDIAIRTWIDNKNIGAAQGIPGFIRFAPGRF